MSQSRAVLAENDFSLSTVNIKGDGMTTDFSINKVVIHELVKEQHRGIQPSNIRNTVLDGRNDAVRKLVTGITSLYGRRNNNAHYGTFRTGEGRGAFPDQFEAYTRVVALNDEVFLTLTHVAMESLYIKAESSPLASGGYILFCDYSTQQGRYFLTAMIKQKEGIKLSATLEPEELVQLDLSRLHQAARINFGKLSAYLAAEERDRLELSYLSFVSPHTGKTAAGYFTTALGCAPGAGSTRATETLIQESTKFFKEREVLQPHAREFRVNLIAYLQRKKESGESAKLSEIEEIARPFMPADESGQADELADAFISHLNSEDLAVPVEFPVSNRALGRYTHIKYRADNWELNFERGALGSDDTADIYYDDNLNRIIINQIPEGAIELIRQELESRRL